MNRINDEDFDDDRDFEYEVFCREDARRQEWEDRLEAEIRLYKTNL